jgi:hypothetical protein
VAEKRLRIKGRFVTREQAFEILGITYDDLMSHEIIQKLLESQAAYMDSQGSVAASSVNGLPMSSMGGGLARF